MHKLGEGLKKRGNHSFGSMLLAAKGPFVETRLGLAPIGSPLSYQQALLPGGFETWLSSDILPGSGKVTFVPDFLPFDDGALATDLPKTLSPDEQHILQVSLLRKMPLFIFLHVLLVPPTLRFYTSAFATAHCTPHSVLLQNRNNRLCVMDK